MSALHVTEEHRSSLATVMKALIAIVCALSLSFAVGCAPKAEKSDSTDISGQVQEGEFDAGIQNPVDWNEWMNRNNNVYAWLNIADTNIDLPILQHPTQDNFYLHMNIDGQADVAGALYTQGQFNSKDFTQDPVTIVYGHTFETNDEMFGTLHNFEDATFFEEHPEFYVYTPTQRFTYEVVSAFENDNKHLLISNDINDPAQRAEFFNMVQNPDSMVKQVRTLETPLNPETDKLLILSTCTKPANDSARYLVVSVLRAVEDTNVQEIVINEPEVLEEETLREANAE